MSGFVGIINFDGELVEPARLQQMTDTLAYQGPDGQAAWIRSNAGLACALFKETVESAQETQPMWFNNEVAIVADARLDARDDLIRRLASKGRTVFADTPDVNLILHAYFVWGEECTAWLAGDFTFAVWDAQSQKLMLARDHFGQRVLFYSQVGTTIIFSNEIQSLIAYPKVTITPNEIAIGDFLLFGQYRWLDKSNTAFSDIKRVPPAHQFIAKADRVRLDPFWSFPAHTPPKRYLKEQDCIEDFRHILGTALQDRLRVDRAGILMSGGLDSSTLAAVAVNLNRRGRSSTQLTALTTVYDHVHPDQERYYAQIVANNLNIPIRFFPVDDYGLEPPSALTTEFAMLLNTRQQIDVGRELQTLGRVVLTGRAGDNLFAPEPIFEGLLRTPLWGLRGYLSVSRFFGKRPAIRSGILSGFRRRDSALAAAINHTFPPWLNPKFVARLNLKERWNTFWATQPQFDHPLHPNMAASLVLPDWQPFQEYVGGLDFTPVRAVDPYMDLRVIEFALSLPVLPWFHKKYLLRQIAREMLPPEIYLRPKKTIGYIYSSLLKQSNIEILSSWKVAPGFADYAQEAMLRDLPAMIERGNPSGLFAWMLNNWLTGLDNLRRG